MRQLLIEVPRGEGKTVLAVAAACNAINVAQMEAVNQTGLLDTVIVHVSNHQVGPLIEALDDQVSEPPHHADPARGFDASPARDGGS